VLQQQGANVGHQRLVARGGAKADVADLGADRAGQLFDLWDRFQYRGRIGVGLAGWACRRHAVLHHWRFVPLAEACLALFGAAR